MTGKMITLYQARNQLACGLSTKAVKMAGKTRETGYTFSLNPDGTFKKYFEGRYVDTNIDIAGCITHDWMLI